MKRLSVIIPGYNTPESLWRRSVKSVMDACGSDDEIICVDDGSTSKVSTGWFAEDGVHVDGRLKLVRLEKNSGLPTARNEALKIATGEYVTFVDSDDEVVPRVYDESIRIIKKYNSDIGVFGVCPIWVDNGLCKHDCVQERDLGVLSAGELSWLFKACLFDYACNKVYRRSFLDNHNLRFDPCARTGEDTIFNCQCVVEGAKWCTVPLEGYIYYRYDGTMLSRYVPNVRDTHQRKLAARKACRDARPGSDALLGGKIEITKMALDRVEWDNMWRRQSPYSLSERWHFLRNHPGLAHRNDCIEFLYRLSYGFLRRHFYIRPIRRWQVKRLFPNAQEWSREV